MRIDKVARRRRLEVEEVIVELKRQDFIDMYEVVAGLRLAQLELIVKVCSSDSVTLEGIDLTWRQHRILEHWMLSPGERFILCKHISEEIIGRIRSPK